MKGILSLNQEEFGRYEDAKVTLILQNGIFLLMLFCDCVLKASDKILSFDKVIRNSLFLTENVTGVSKRFLLERVLMQLPINVMENAFFLKIFIKRQTFVGNLENSNLENV